MPSDTIKVQLRIWSVITRMQNVGNLFEVDTVQSVVHHVEHIAGKTYKQDPKTCLLYTSRCV